MAELIIIDENQKLNYFQKCKIVINKIENRLSMSPNNNETEFVVINFGEKCYQKNKILIFFPTNNESRKFLLIFKSSETCKKVYNVVVQNNQDDENQLSEAFQNQVFAPILYEIKSNTLANPKLAEIIIDFVNSLEDEKEKLPFFDAIKNTKLDSLFANLNSNIATASISRVSPTNYFPQNLNASPNQSRSLQSSCEVLKFNFPLKTNLVKDAVSNDRKSSLRKRPLLNISYCENVENDDLKDKSNDEEEYSFSGKNEQDPPFKRQRWSAKNVFEKILPSNTYEIITYEIFGQLKTRLIIFLSADKKICYEYYWDNTKKIFICCGCRSNKEKKIVSAIKSRDQSGNECIKVNSAEHVCHPIEYDPEKFKSDIKIYSQDYELFKCTKYGVENKYLIVFTSNEKDLCYEFHYNEKRKRFYCLKCQNKKHEILAAICKDESQKEYVSIRNYKHVCQPIQYVSNKYIDQEIIYHPNFQLYEKWSKGKIVQKLAIFCDENKELCYEYSKINDSYYQCFKCPKINKKHIVSAKLIKNGDNETFVQLFQNKHICKPQNYIEKESTIFVRKPNFKVEIIRKHFGVLRKQLYIFYSGNPNLCYIYNNHGNYYVCHECNKLKKYIAARIWKDENDEEFVELFNNKHECKPQKYVSENEIGNITSVDIDQGIDELKKETISPKLIKPEKIIKSPNFKIDSITRDSEILFQQLTIFDSKNPNLSYIYYFSQRDQVYYCKGCKEKGKYVTAKFHQNDNVEEDFIELGEANHVCEPQPNEKIFLKNEIQLRKVSDGKISKLIIFDPQNKDLCYDFNPTRHSCFRCHGCFTKSKKYKQAKLFEDENSQYYVKLGNIEHICTPVIYESIKL